MMTGKGALRNRLGITASLEEMIIKNDCDHDDWRKHQDEWTSDHPGNSSNHVVYISLLS
jgi:hypothetical protein